MRNKLKTKTFPWQKTLKGNISNENKIVYVFHYSKPPYQYAV